MSENQPKIVSCRRASRPAPGRRRFVPTPPARSSPQSNCFWTTPGSKRPYRLERTWESADIYPEPVLKPETAWEGHQLTMFGSVFRHGTEWRMYYVSYNRPAPSLCCLAYSHDGVRWERPNLGCLSFRATKNNNIVLAPPPGEDNDGPPSATIRRNSKAPYKMMYYGYGKLARGEYVSFSKDGIVWDRHTGPVMTTGDRTNLMGVATGTGNSWPTCGTRI